MKKFVVTVFLVFVFSTSSISLPPAHATDLTLNNTPARVYFSPHGGCTAAIVKELDNARSEILMEAYSFTSKDIASAILNAHKRGVHVEIILDKSNRSARYSSGDFTSHMGITTYINAAYAIAHNKIMIIDREIVITGSFNFTKAAEEKNAENLLILRNKDLAGLYLGNWENHREHSDKIPEYEHIKRGHY
jgi:Phosphatidylserine/phosphatidylglycerophosphate/cardiolipin synthases and related enzymes